MLWQTAYAAVLRTLQAALGRTDVRPGCVVSLQTYGGYGCNFNPHAHALVSDGVFSRDGEFLPLPAPDPAAVMDVLRRLFLERLHRAERLSESFMHNLLSCVHPGFSVFAGPPVDGAALASLECQGRYITRPALAMNALRKVEGGTLSLETPPDPRTGATRVVLDPLEWIHRISAHIPGRGSHCQRFYGAYSNRGRKVCVGRQAHSPAAGARAPDARDNSDFSREARSTWARLVRKIFEADPLTCGACGGRMRIIYYRRARRRPCPAPSGKRALQGEGSIRAARTAARPGRHCPVKLAQAVPEAVRASGWRRCAGLEDGTRPGNSRLGAGGALPACLPLKNRVLAANAPPVPNLPRSFPDFCLSHTDFRLPPWIEMLTRTMRMNRTFPLGSGRSFWHRQASKMEEKDAMEQLHHEPFPLTHGVTRGGRTGYGHVPGAGIVSTREPMQ